MPAKFCRHFFMEVYFTQSRKEGVARLLMDDEFYHDVTTVPRLATLREKKRTLPESDFFWHFCIVNRLWKKRRKSSSA